MPRPEKAQAVADIKEAIEDARAVFLTEFRGLTVKQMQTLRRSLRDSGASYKVVKMSLARRAVDELGIDGVDEYLAGPTGLTFAGDAVAAAKVLRDTNRDHEALVIKAGILAGRLIAPEQVSKLADIEPREVLLSKIAGAGRAPMAQFAGMVASFTHNAAGMFAQLLEKKESGAAAEGGAASSRDAREDMAAQAEEE